VFAPAFLVVAFISSISAYFFWQMPDDAGHEISGRKAVEISSRKGAALAATKTRPKRLRMRGISGWVDTWPTAESLRHWRRRHYGRCEMNLRNETWLYVMVVTAIQRCTGETPQLARAICCNRTGASVPSCLAREALPYVRFGRSSCETP